MTNERLVKLIAQNIEHMIRVGQRPVRVSAHSDDADVFAGATDIAGIPIVFDGAVGIVDVVMPEGVPGPLRADLSRVRS